MLARADAGVNKQSAPTRVAPQCSALPAIRSYFWPSLFFFLIAPEKHKKSKERLYLQSACGWRLNADVSPWVLKLTPYGRGFFLTCLMALMALMTLPWNGYSLISFFPKCAFVLYGIMTRWEMPSVSFVLSFSMHSLETVKPNEAKWSYFKPFWCLIQCTLNTLQQSEANWI